MKKIALTSLLAVVAASGANAANIIDGNPLYMPGQNRFYSVTDLYSHTKDTPWVVGEEFGYGILDNLAVNITTSLGENKAFDEYGWNDFGTQLTFRALDMNGWKLDVYGAYAFSGLYRHPVAHGQDAWFDKDATGYTWLAGVRGGFVGSNWTVAGRTEFFYENTESFNWNEKAGKMGEHSLTLALDGQYVINDDFNLVATVEYTGRLDKHYNGGNVKVKNEGTWFGEFGVNYNFDATKFVGLYVNGEIAHATGDWEWEDGFGFGAKFGIDF